MNFIVPSWIWKVLITLALAAGVLYMVFDNGRTYERNIAAAKALELAKANKKVLDAEIERSRAAALDYSVQHQALRDRYDDLNVKMDELRRRTPIVVPAPRRPASAAVPGGYSAPAPTGRGLSAGATGDAQGSAQPQTPAEFPQPHSRLEDDDDEVDPNQSRLVFVAATAEADLDLDAPPRLSLGAVRLWNSALAGVDLPAGACGAAGAPAGACAAASATDFDAAWRNHERNAESCAADRHQLQTLIDYLQQRAAFNQAGAALRPAP